MATESRSIQYYSQVAVVLGVLAVAVMHCNSSPENVSNSSATKVTSGGSFNPSDPAASGMALTFDDEFNSLSLSDVGPADGHVWTNHQWYEGPSPAGSFSVSNGTLNANIWNSGGGWTAAEMESTNSSGQGFAQKYGYWEISAKLAKGDGLMNQFFLMSNDRVKNSGAVQSEIDVMETPGNQITSDYTTVHRDSGGVVGDAQNQNLGGNDKTDVGVDLSQDFHRYGVLWSPNDNYIHFYLDGKDIMDVSKFDTTDSAPMMMILGQYANGWGGSVDSSTPNPSTMQVDYVRVWQFADQNPQAVQPQQISPPPGSTPTPPPAFSLSRVMCVKKFSNLLAW